MMGRNAPYAKQAIIFTEERAKTPTLCACLAHLRRNSRSPKMPPELVKNEFICLRNFIIIPLSQECVNYASSPFLNAAFARAPQRFAADVSVTITSSILLVMAFSITAATARRTQFSQQETALDTVFAKLAAEFTKAATSARQLSVPCAVRQIICSCFQTASTMMTVMYAQLLINISTQEQVNNLQKIGFLFKPVLLNHQVAAIAEWLCPIA